MTTTAVKARATAHNTFASLVETMERTNKDIAATDNALMTAQRSHPKPPRTRVFGGRNEAYSFVTNGRTMSFPESEWFYSSDEEIDRDLDKELGAKNITDVERRSIEARRKDLHAQLATAIKERERQIHPSIKVAKAAVLRAEKASTAALAEIVSHKPSSWVEALEMLRFVTKQGGESGILSGDEVIAIIHSVIATIDGPAAKD